MRVLVATSLLLGGCDTVFGLDRPTPDGAPPDEVSVHYRRVALTNTSDSTTPVDIALANAEVRVTFPDGTTVTPTLGADGRFTFPRLANAPYYLYTHAPPDMPVEYQLSSASLDIGLKRTARPDLVVPSTNTRLSLRIGVWAAVGQAAMQATGLWAQKKQDAGGNDTQLDIPWTDASLFLGGPGLLEPEKGDRLFCSFFEPVGVDYDHIVASGEATIEEMTDGEESVANCTLVAAPRFDCVTLDIGYTNENRRLKTAGGNVEFLTVTTQTKVLAVPAPDHSPAGFDLVTKLISGPGDGFSTDFRANVSVMQPFGNHSLLVMARSSRTRDLKFDNTTQPTPLSLETYRWFPIPASELECDRPLDTSATVALPTAAALDDVQLMTDGQRVQFDRRARVPLTWQMIAGGTVDRFLVRLFEVSAVNGNTMFAAVQAWVTLEPTLDIDPALLVAGKKYIFTIESNIGYPNARQGEFVTLAYPFGIAQFSTTMFEVAP